MNTVENVLRMCEDETTTVAEMKSLLYNNNIPFMYMDMYKAEQFLLRLICKLMDVDASKSKLTDVICHFYGCAQGFMSLDMFKVIWKNHDKFDVDQIVKNITVVDSFKNGRGASQEGIKVVLEFFHEQSCMSSNSNEMSVQLSIAYASTAEIYEPVMSEDDFCDDEDYCYDESYLWIM